MKKLKFWQVDSFTNKPFGGNPAAVIIHDFVLDDALMHSIAIEMNLSETAFVFLQENKNPFLRWYTPMSEVDLCGHATLAAAHIYLNNLYPDLDEVIFDTKFVGQVKVTKNVTSLTINFPSRPGDEVLLDSIEPFVLESLSNTKPIYARKARDLMLVYESERTIYDMKPNFHALLDYEPFIIVTAKSENPKYDFISRFFCASDGISEDPVTGSAHCTLAPYWSNVLVKNKMRAYQASKRGGELDLELSKDRLYITGQAIVVIEGSLQV